MLAICAENYRLGCKGRPFHKMKKKSGTSKDAADKLVRGIKRKTRKHYSAEEKIRVVLAGCPSSEFFGELRLYRNGGSGSVSV